VFSKSKYKGGRADRNTSLSFYVTEARSQSARKYLAGVQVQKYLASVQVQKYLARVRVQKYLAGVQVQKYLADVRA
jgi:hypothetical protein